MRVSVAGRRHFAIVVFPIDFITDGIPIFIQDSSLGGGHHGTIFLTYSFRLVWRWFYR